MKIGYLLQTGVPDMRSQPPTGPTLHVRHVIEELRALGHEVRLLWQWQDQIYRSDDLVHFEVQQIPWLQRGPVRWGERLLRRIQRQLGLPYIAFFESLRFAWLCRRCLSDCDLLYERMGWAGYAGAVAARWRNIPLIFEINGDHLTEMKTKGVAPRGLQRILSKRLMRWAAQQATHAVATGEGWRRRHSERWGVSPEKVTYVQNGSEVVHLLEREELRAFQPAAEGDSGQVEPVSVIYVGAFEAWHGVAILVRAAAKARAQGAPIHLTLVGAGEEEEKIRQSIHETGMAEHVSLPGFLGVNQFAALLAQAEIGVSPYCGRVEYTGLKLLDYKAAGLVTLASGADGQPDVLRHGETGWIVPPCDEESLAAALVELSHNRQLRRCIGQKARLEAEQVHSWQCVAQRLDGIFQKVRG